MTALVVVAPTDAQLAYIAGLCEERGLEPPAGNGTPTMFPSEPQDRGVSIWRVAAAFATAGAITGADVLIGAFVRGIRGSK